MPDPDAAARMEVWDSLPEAFRRWLMDYPRGLTTFDCARALDMHGGNVAKACAFIERRLPVPPDQRTPLVARPRHARAAGRAPTRPMARSGHGRMGNEAEA
jgi:hypothetical protein